MKNKCFLTLLTALAVSNAMMAQVRVQPVKDVHTVVIEDAVSLKVYLDSTRGTELEVSSNDPVARVKKGVMNMDGATSAVLYLAPESPITHFRVEDAASLEFIGPMDFGDRQFTVNAEDAGKVKMTKASQTDTIRTGYVILHAGDGARIVGEVPLLLTSYTLHSEGNSYIELPSIDIKPGTVTDDKTYEMITSDNGKVRVLGYVAHLNLNLDQMSADSVSGRHEHVVKVKRSNSSARDLEANYFWGFVNWGNKPFSGFGGMSGDAAATYYFMNYGISIDYPLINTRHFGLYAGLGYDGVMIHFENSIVNATLTGFQASTSSMVQSTSGTLDPNNWNSYFTSGAITVPVTFSFEPWKYDGLCVRLSAIPGVNLYGYLNQQYDSKAVQISANDREIRKQMNPFMLDTRLSLMYGDIGLYAQVATLPMFKSGFEPLYPVKFGFIWTMSGR